jgi:hypothetical protein
MASLCLWASPCWVRAQTLSEGGLAQVHSFDVVDMTCGLVSSRVNTTQHWLAVDTGYGGMYLRPLLSGGQFCLVGCWELDSLRCRSLR